MKGDLEGGVANSLAAAALNDTGFRGTVVKGF